MDTIVLTIPAGEALQELLIAALQDLDFYAFEQADDCVRAYVPAARWDDVKRAHVEAWLRTQGLTTATREINQKKIPAQNWNRQWEETIRPVVVGPFLIKPTWAAPPPEAHGRILLEIDPKMSFGTGYHESTRLALRFLPGLVQPGMRVLDAGTGTGILAIAALKLGAASAVAFDVDPWAQQNAAENFYLNAVADRVTFHAGALEVVPEAGFDLLLANINLGVLLDLLPAFAGKTRPGGRAVLAGLLHQDRARLLEAAAACGWHGAQESVEGAWWAVVLGRERETGNRN